MNRNNNNNYYKNYNNNNNNKYKNRPYKNAPNKDVCIAQGKTIIDSNQIRKNVYALMVRTH